jgi:hypothetical protein
MNEQFKSAWNTTGTKFTPSALEWLAWLGQPMLYDGGLCVNRTTEEYEESQRQRGVLSV